jgi:CRP-like cAMP-binding protein
VRSRLHVQGSDHAAPQANSAPTGSRRSIRTNKVRLARIPYRVKSLADGEYAVREEDKPSSCIVVIDGFLARQRVVNDRDQISSFYLAGDMPDLPSLHLSIADCDLCSIGNSTIAAVPH